MAEVTLQIGDRQHRIACKDGTEDDVRRIAAQLDTRWAAASRASGGLNDERSMLFVALMLADALDEAERKAAPTAAVQSPVATPDLEILAGRLESIAAALENIGPLVNERPLENEGQSA